MLSAVTRPNIAPAKATSWAAKLGSRSSRRPSWWWKYSVQYSNTSAPTPSTITLITAASGSNRNMMSIDSSGTHGTSTRA